jgi:hypothetical protein
VKRPFHIESQQGAKCHRLFSEIPLAIQLALPVAEVVGLLQP